MIASLLQHAKGIALLAPGCEPLVWPHLLAHIEGTVGALNQAGIGRGDRVAIVLPNGPAMATAFLAVATGAVAAPLNPAYRRSEFEFFLGDLQPRALLVAAGVASPARDVASSRGIPILELVLTREAGVFTLHRACATAPATRTGWAAAEEHALLLHTSGTAARPKLVALTGANLAASAHHISHTLRLTPADRCLNVMPLFHIHGLIAALLSSLSAGASVVCTPGFDAARFFPWLDVFEPNWYTAVPTIHQAVLGQASAHRETIARRPLRFIRSSSSALPPTVMSELESVFSTPVVEAYGMTEAAHQMACNPLPPAPRKPGSVGLPAGTQITILDDGEVAIRGANVTAGYVNNDSANAEAFQNGWFRTGDLGRIDENGYLYLTGRSNEIINRGGEKISPREIDEALLEHPAIAQAVTFGTPHPTLGQEIAAAVVLRPASGASAPELREFLSARLADFKIPRQIVFRDELPKGSTGKIQRIGMAERLGIAATAHTAPETATQQRIAGIWSEMLRTGDVGLDDDYSQLGGDSLLAAQLILRIEEAFDINVSELDLFEVPNVRGMAERIEARLGEVAMTRKPEQT